MTPGQERAITLPLSKRLSIVEEVPEEEAGVFRNPGIIGVVTKSSRAIRFVNENRPAVLDTVEEVLHEMFGAALEDVSSKWYLKEDLRQKHLQEQLL